MTRALGPADEKRHVPLDDPGWCEAFTFDFVADDATIAGALGLVLFPEFARCTFWTCLAGDRQFLTIVESDLAMPRDLELRAPGLWFEIQVLVPGDHAMVGLEAFAVGLDDPADALGRLWGDRVPFGLDLEWDGGLSPIDQPLVGTDGYELMCRVHGEVLVAEARIEFDGFGSRSHTWGTPHPWTRPWQRIVHGDAVAWPQQVPGQATVLANAPMRVSFPDGTACQVDRALATVAVPGSPSGDPRQPAWIERNLPC